MSKDFLTLDYRKVSRNIGTFISKQVKLRKKNGVVIGLSGGVDSSVCLLLAHQALRKRLIIGLSMPEKHVPPKKDQKNVCYLSKNSESNTRKLALDMEKRFY